MLKNNEKSVEPVFSGHPRKIRKWPFNTAGLTLNGGLVQLKNTHRNTYIQEELKILA